MRFIRTEDARQEAIEAIDNAIAMFTGHEAERNLRTIRANLDTADGRWLVQNPQAFSNLALTVAWSQWDVFKTAGLL